MKAALHILAVFVISTGTLAVWLVLELRTLDNPPHRTPNPEPRTPKEPQ